MDKRRFIPDLSIASALFVLNLLVLGPFLLMEYSSEPWNNSYVYMAISRMFRDHRWTWNALQYAGAPFHYLYPPVFHVLAAYVPFVSIGRAFHLVTGVGYALVPVCLYVLAFQLLRSRVLAGLVGIAYSIFPSPVYFFSPTWKGLAVKYAGAPWSYVAMIGYEEAAHAFALSFTLLAVAAAWRNKWTLAALLAAVVFLTNWPALIGLGLVLIALAVTRSRDMGFIPAGSRVAGVVGTAYGLSAFWMSPGYFVSSTLLNRIVIQNTNVTTPWSLTTVVVLLGAAGLAALSFWRRIPRACALVLVWIAITGAVVMSFSLTGTWLVPMPNRYMLEFNAGVLLGVAALISVLPQWRNLVAGLVLVAGMLVSFNFVSHAWKFQPTRQDPKDLVSVRIADWLKSYANGSRVLAAGELDSTLALWSDVPQAGGTGQDVSNFIMFAAQRQVTFGCGGKSEQLAESWLRALGVGYFVVHESNSREYFHWFSEARKFAGMPVVWDDGEGDKIYKVRDQDEAVVVDLTMLSKLPDLRSTDDPGFVSAYAAWARGKRSVPVIWTGEDSIEMNVRPGPGEGLLLKMNFDRGWRVSSGVVERDPIGFVLLRGLGSHDSSVGLRYGASWDVWLGRALTLVTVVFLLLRIPGWWIAVVAVVPAVIAYLVLLQGVPQSAAVAEAAFARLQPPLISPGGIVDGATNQMPPFKRGRTISMYGLNFGTKTEVPHVWLGDREAAVVYHAPNMIAFQLPSDAPAVTEVSVEVNGCRGNAFTFATQ